MVALQVATLVIVVAHILVQLFAINRVKKQVSIMSAKFKKASSILSV